jgi:hypothetical protein
MPIKTEIHMYAIDVCKRQLSNLMTPEIMHRDRNNQAGPKSQEIDVPGERENLSGMSWKDALRVIVTSVTFLSPILFSPPDTAPRGFGLAGIYPEP